MVRTTRRRVMAGGLVGAALLGVGSALSWLTRGYDAGERRAVALSAKELVIVAAIVDALFPARGAFPAGASVGVIERIDEEVYSQAPGLAADLKAALHLIEHAPPLLGVPHRLSAIADVDERAAVLQRLAERGPDVVVQVVVALKELASLAYFAAPEVWPALGYDGPWVATAVPPPSHQRYLAALERAR